MIVCRDTANPNGKIRKTQRLGKAEIALRKDKEIWRRNKIFEIDEGIKHGMRLSVQKGARTDLSY